MIEYIMVLGGLAMLCVLRAAFVASFKDRFALGALVSFLVTVADLAILNIGAALWGLVAGFAVSRLLEARDFASPADNPEPVPPGRSAGPATSHREA